MATHHQQRTRIRVGKDDAQRALVIRLAGQSVSANIEHWRWEHLHVLLVSQLVTVLRQCVCVTRCVTERVSIEQISSLPTTRKEDDDGHAEINDFRLVS